MGKVRIEKKSIGPAQLPSFEAHNGAHHRVKERSTLVPWWLVLAHEVHPGETVIVRAHSQLPFRGERLSIDPLIAPHFRVLDVRVGNNSFCINGNSGAKATLFPPLPDKLTTEEREEYESLLAMNLDTASVGMTIGVQVVNDSTEKRYFSGILWGVSAII